MIRSECETITTNSNIKVAEPRSTSAVFANPGRDQYSVVRFDGCVVKGSVACDFIVHKKGVGRLAVELKGCDVVHATQQIEKALHFLKDCGMLDLPVGGLVVCTKYPSMDTTVQRMKQKLAKSFRAPLTVKTDGRNLDFASLVRL